MTTTTKTAARWQVVCAYDCPFGTRWTVISTHKTYELAAKALKRKAPGESGNWLGLREKSVESA